MFEKTKVFCGNVETQCVYQDEYKFSHNTVLELLLYKNVV